MASEPSDTSPTQLQQEELVHPRETAQATAPRPSYLPAFLAMAWVALISFSFAFTPFRSSQDDFWHLKAGMLQVEHGFPIHGTEPFSYNAADRIWHNHEWLAQRWFYRVFATAPEGDLQGGLFRLILFKSVIVAATFVLVCWAVAQRGAGWATAALCAVVAAEVSRRTIYVRPPIFSYLFMAGFLAMLHQWKAGRLRGRWLWALPPMTVLWANLHGMVPLAIVCTGAYAAGEWIEALLRPGLRAPLRQRLESLVQSATVRLTTAVLLVTALATLAQPSGIGLYSLAGNFTKDPLLQRTIAEMLPTKWFLQPGPDGSTVFVPGFVTFWVLLFATAAVWIWNRGRLQHWADGLLIVFFAYQAVMHWRLLPLFAIAATPAFGWLLSQRVIPALQRVLPPSIHPDRVLAVLALVLGLVYTTVIDEHQTYLQRNITLARGRALDSPHDYPVPIVRALLSARPPGNLYSPSNYCGWFMWWLAPEAYRTYADNRFDHFGSEFLHDELVMRMVLRPGVNVMHRPVERTWQETIAHHGIRTIVIERSAPLHDRLRTWPGFRPVYIYVPPGSTRPDAGWAIWVTTDEDATTASESLIRRFQNENPGAPPPEVIEGYKPDPNSPEPPLPEMAK